MSFWPGSGYLGGVEASLGSRVPCMIRLGQGQSTECLQEVKGDESKGSFLIEYAPALCLPGHHAMVGGLPCKANLAAASEVVVEVHSYLGVIPWGVRNRHRHDAG